MFRTISIVALLLISFAAATGAVVPEMPGILTIEGDIIRVDTGNPSYSITSLKVYDASGGLVISFTGCGLPKCDFDSGGNLLSGETYHFKVITEDGARWISYSIP